MDNIKNYIWKKATFFNALLNLFGLLKAYRCIVDSTQSGMVIAVRSDTPT